MSTHNFSGIRTHDSSNQRAASLRLRPHGHRVLTFYFTSLHLFGML